MQDRKFSVIFYTIRPGNIDMIVNSMKAQTYQNFELILVDDYPDRDFNKVAEYCKEKGVDMLHIPSKKKCYPDTPYGQVNALNTGILRSTGDIILALSDFSWVRPDALEKWNKFYDEYGHEFCGTGVGQIWDKPGFQPIIDDIKITPDEMTSFPQPGWKECGVWIPKVWEMFYFTVPRWYLRETNALDERADYWREWPIAHFMIQGGLHNLKLVIADSNPVDILNHRRWGPKSLWHINYMRQSTKWQDITDEGLRPKQFPFKIGKKNPNCFTFV